MSNQASPFVREDEMYVAPPTSAERARKIIAEHDYLHVNARPAALHLMPTWEQTITKALDEQASDMRGELERTRQLDRLRAERSVLDGLVQTLMRLMGEIQQRETDILTTKRNVS